MSDECKKVKIIRGSKTNFPLKLKLDGDGYDLSTNHEVEICFPGESGTPVSVNKSNGVSILAPTRGKIQVEVPAAASSLMAVGEDQSIQINVIDVDGEDPTSWQILECVDVIEKIC